MDAAFWHRRWQKNEIGFHEGRPNALLEAHWHGLGLKAGALIFVPLCGKALDMAWLAAHGHRVLGVELSDIAVRDFFAENGLDPNRRREKGFEVYASGAIEIWHGDLFALAPSHLAGLDAVYDRASLIALPPEMQPAYARKIAELVPADVPILLITLDYPEAQAEGPPFATPPARVAALFGAAFTCAEIAARDALASSPNLQRRGLTWAPGACHDPTTASDERAVITSRS